MDGADEGNSPITYYGVYGAGTAWNLPAFTISSQLALIGGWWCLITRWHSHFCCQMLSCLVGIMIRPPVGKVTDSVYWPPPLAVWLTRCVRVRLCVPTCVCVWVCFFFIVVEQCVCVCVARWRGAHAALIRPLIPGCCNTVGVKSDTLSWGWDEMLTWLLCARVIKSYVYTFRGMDNHYILKRIYLFFWLKKWNVSSAVMSQRGDI